MKIIQRAKKNHYKFIVLKPFMWNLKPTLPGDEIEIPLQGDQEGMTKQGMIRPSDLVDGLIYVALKPFILPGNEKKFETKAMELVSLKASDALELMFQRCCLPRDDDQWRPFKMKLAAPPKGNPARFETKIEEPPPPHQEEEVKPKIRITKDTMVTYSDGSNEKFEKGTSGWFGNETANKLVAQGVAIFIE
jgi:hypothetical protein